jgi:hypothetical protein
MKPPVADRVAVEHVGPHRHRHLGAARRDRGDVHAELLRRGVAVEHRARDAIGERLRLRGRPDRRGVAHAASFPSDCAARASRGDGRYRSSP